MHILQGQSGFLYGFLYTIFMESLKSGKFAILFISQGKGFQMTGPKYLKGALSGLRQFLAIESPLKIMKNAFRSQDI